MFMCFFIFVVFFFMMFLNTLYLWVLLEVIFFLVLGYLVFLTKDKDNMMSVVFYLFIQALSSLLILLALLSELMFYSNHFMFSNSVGVLSYWVCLMSLLVKVSLYPFYYQIFFIMLLLNYEQSFLFLVYPKLLPLLLLFELIQSYFIMFFFLTFLVVLFLVSGVYGNLSVSLMELMGWSGLSQLSWLVFSLNYNIFSFLFFFILYSILFYYFMNFMSNYSTIFFSSMGGLKMMSFKNLLFFVIILFLSSLAPMLFFYIKVFLLSTLNNLNLLLQVLFMLLSSVLVLFFYLRLLQTLFSVGFTNSFYSTGMVSLRYGLFFFVIVLFFMMSSFMFLMF